MKDQPIKIEALIDEIHARRAERAKERQQVFPQRVPRGSSIGECLREMTYQITHWQLRPPPSEWLAHRFQRGHVIEGVVRKEMAELGFFIECGQLATDIKDRDGTVICTTHIDGRLRYGGLLPVWENKSIHPLQWSRFRTLEDFRNGPAWARKYPAQLMIYMYACSEPYGLLQLDNCLGLWHFIPIHLEDHLEEVEGILRNLRRVVDAARKPDGAEHLPYCDDPTACKGCWCREAGLCFPPQSPEGVQVLTDSELLEAMESLRNDREAARRYEQADELLKCNLHNRGAGRYLIGDGVVTVKEVKTTKYTIPDEVKKPYAITTTQLRKTISFPEGE